MVSVLVDHRGQPLTSWKQGEGRLSDLRPTNRIRALYDSAQTTDNNEDYWGRADGLSARAALSPGVRKVIRDRCRYEVANNCYAKGMIRTYADYVIGTGPTLQLLTDDKEYNDAVERRFHTWATAVGFYRKLWTMAFAFVQDGEAFGVFHTNYRLQNPVNLDLQLIEAEQIADGDEFSLLDWKRNDGLVLDSWGNVIAYKKLKYHPGDQSWTNFSEKPELLPARDVIHLYRVERPGQLRGVSHIAPALMLYPTLRRWTYATLNAAEHAARLSGVIKSTYQPTDPKPVAPLEAIEIEANMMLTMPEGWDISQLKPEHPQSTYPMFKREVVAEIARCLNMPFNVAAATNQDMNFASGKLDHTGWFKTVKIDEQLIADQAADLAFSRWYERAALLDGYLPPEPDELDPKFGTPDHIWNWDGQEMIDPREADAQATALQNGITTIPELYAKRGKDWFEQLTNGAKALNMSLEEYQTMLTKQIFSGAAKVDQAEKAAKMAGDTKERESAQAA